MSVEAAEAQLASCPNFSLCTSYSCSKKKNLTVPIVLLGIDLRLYFVLPSHKIFMLLLSLTGNCIVNSVECLNI
jgi:hypothetical protein